MGLSRLMRINLQNKKNIELIKHTKKSITMFIHLWWRGKFFISTLIIQRTYPVCCRNTYFHRQLRRICQMQSILVLNISTFPRAYNSFGIAAIGIQVIWRQWTQQTNVLGFVTALQKELAATFVCLLLLLLECVDCFSGTHWKQSQIHQGQIIIVTFLPQSQVETLIRWNLIRLLADKQYTFMQ